MVPSRDRIRDLTVQEEQIERNTMETPWKHHGNLRAPQDVYSTNEGPLTGESIGGQAVRSSATRPPAMTERKAHLTPEHKRKAVESLPDRGTGERDSEKWSQNEKGYDPGSRNLLKSWSG